MKKEFELYLLSDDCGWCDGKEWQMGTYEINNLWQWIETKIDEACKKQREIINDNIGGWKESMGFAIQHAIEQQEQEYREEYFLGREEAFKYAVRMHDEHFNAPSPKESE